MHGRMGPPEGKGGGLAAAEERRVSAAGLRGDERPGDGGGGPQFCCPGWPPGWRQGQV